MGRQAGITAGAVFLLVLGLRFAGALERLELGVWDLSLRARPAAPVDERFVMIDETEDDLKRFGHPLPDEVLARVVERALALGPRVLGVDKFRDLVPLVSRAAETGSSAAVAGRHRAALLEQIGLKDIAAHERQLYQ